MSLQKYLILNDFVFEPITLYGRSIPAMIFRLFPNLTTGMLRPYVGQHKFN